MIRSEKLCPLDFFDRNMICEDTPHITQHLGCQRVNSSVILASREIPCNTARIDLLMRRGRENRTFVCVPDGSWSLYSSARGRTAQRTGYAK